MLTHDRREGKTCRLQPQPSPRSFACTSKYTRYLAISASVLNSNFSQMFSLLRLCPLKTAAVVIQHNIRGRAFDMDNQAIPNPVHISNRQGNNPVIGVRTDEIACSIQFGISNASSKHLNNHDRAV